jgi:hypothetical protein
MSTTLTIDGANIIINSIPLEELLHKFYQKGWNDAFLVDKNEKVSFVKLHQELLSKGRKISIRTLTAKARGAKVKLFTFDGNRLAVYRKDIPLFISY